MAFNPKVIQQGNLAKQQAEETPTSFATSGGVSSAQPSGDLDKKNEVRMAGPGPELCRYLWLVLEEHSQ